MRMNESNVTKMFEIIESGRLISRLSFTKAQFFDWANTLNKINSLPFGVTILDGYLLSDYTVPSKLESLVVPIRIQVENVNHATNYKSEKHYAYVPLKVTEAEQARILSPIEFNLLSGAINGTRKAEYSQVIGVNTRRSDVLLSTDSNKYIAEKNLKARALDAKFVPVVITTQLYDSTMYTEDASSMLIDWFFYTMVNYKAAQ